MGYSILKDDNYQVTETDIHTYKGYKNSEGINIKGKSDYEDKSIIDDLPRNKEFIVVEDWQESDQGGDLSWNFTILIKYYNKYYSIADVG